MERWQAFLVLTVMLVALGVLIVRSGRRSTPRPSEESEYEDYGRHTTRRCADVSHHMGDGMLGATAIERGWRTRCPLLQQRSTNATVARVAYRDRV